MNDSIKDALNPIQHRKVYLIGGGIASLASAAYFIRDGHINPRNITIYEELDIAGGSLDGSGSPETGYVMRGGRMLNFSYLCTYDLFSFIPSLGAIRASWYSMKSKLSIRTLKPIQRLV
jgi:oleate hydratase